MDRRVVDSTTDSILADEELKLVFQNISQIPSLMDLAPVLNLSTLTIAVRDAGREGIVASVTGLLAENKISIRQTVSEDPEFTDEPRLYIVTDEPIPGEVLNELRELSFVRKLELQ